MIDKMVTPPENDLSREAYMEKFAAILVLLCAAGTGFSGLCG